ncbi:MAG TPA: DnaJ domain-containing protein [Candidatus Acidoferrales bacterium]|nr:DnaJ domain-containing protein [Candidatus Acidoferrales bacterium]
MIRKDYYLVLGVSRGESFRGIQEAFRELAKRYHPDRAGPEGTRKFQDIQEAYEVLSDPEKRKLYNHELEREERMARPEPEPLSPRGRPGPAFAEPLSVLHGFETIRPSFEPLFERFVRNFTRENIPKGERLQDLNIEVVLSPEEALRGVVVPIGVPVFYACPHCGGSGSDWLFPCLGCNAQGVIETEQTVRVRVPPMTPDRAVLEVPIHGLGVHNFYLRLHIRIDRSSLF